MKPNVALAGRGGAEAAPAGSTPRVAQPAPKKNPAPKKTLLKHVTKLWRLEKKKRAAQLNSPHVLCKCCRSISNFGGENEHPGENASCPSPSPGTRLPQGTKPDHPWAALTSAWLEAALPAQFSPGGKVQG